MKFAPLVAVLFLLAMPAPEGVWFTVSSSGIQTGWPGVDGNYPLNWNYSPQRAIGTGNVNSLQTAWTFPVPAAVSNYTGAEGAMVTPLVINGIVYIVANWHRLFALDASTGNVVWYRDLPLLRNYSMYVQPSIPGPNGIPLGHYHQMIYTDRLLGKPLVWVISNTYQVFALDAYTGDVVVDFSPLARDWPTIVGNHGLYDVDTPTIVIDQRRGVLLFSPSVSEGQSSGRGYVEAWKVNTAIPTFLWRDYLIPPQDGSDPGWSLRTVQSIGYASVFNGTGAVDLKALPQEELRRTLYGDWGNFGYDGSRSYAGAGAGWGGSWAIDETAGVAYVSTSTATPDWNASERPGLDLWSDSVLAVNLTSGGLIWAFQAMPHPLGDFDCSWNVVLANETIGGQTTPVVYKGCKDGHVFALNAKTGKMIWFLKPPSIRWDNVRALNPLNSTQMAKYNWNGYPKTGKLVQNPSDTGALESDLAYDPANGMVFAAVYNSPKLFQFTDVGTGNRPFSMNDWEFNWGVNVYSITQESPVNTTVIAIDGGTGKVRWSHLIENLPYRGGLTVSGGVVYATTLDGILRYLSEADGTLIGQKTIGGSLIAQPSIGQDADGTEMIYLTDMGSSRWGPVFPGFIQALVPKLPPSSPAPYLWYGIYAGVGLAAVLAAAALYAAIRALKRSRGKELSGSVEAGGNRLLRGAISFAPRMNPARSPQRED